MKEYIEKAMAFATLVDFPGELSPENIGLAVARKAIDALPATDVVDVTFCKDCRYYQDAKVNEKGFLICPASGMEITETDYCSYGERKIETVLPKSDAKDGSLEADHEVS